MSITDMVEKMTASGNNHLSETLLVCNNKNELITFCEHLSLKLTSSVLKYSPQQYMSMIQKVTRTWVAAAYPDSTTFRSKAKWTVWWTSNRSKVSYNAIQQNHVLRFGYSDKISYSVVIGNLQKHKGECSRPDKKSTTSCV